jgi:hypothetical protein
MSDDGACLRLRESASCCCYPGRAFAAYGCAFLQAIAISDSRSDNDAVTLIITTVGAVLTTLLGVCAGSVLTNRTQQRQWSRDRQADACAQVLRESSNVLIELNKMTRQPIQPAPDGARIPTSIDWKAWNEALAMVALIADHAIFEAALAIDAQIWPVHQQIKRGWLPEGGWIVLRESIDLRRHDFVNVARKHLAAPGPPVRRLTGRPSSNDPFWEFRRSYFSPEGSAEEEQGVPTAGEEPVQADARHFTSHPSQTTT